MSYDTTPIHAYVEQKYLSGPVQKHVDGWRLEPKVVIDRLVDHFRDMGIYRVTRQNESIVSAGILHLLKNSPEILRLVQRAYAEEQRRAKTRHTGNV